MSREFDRIDRFFRPLAGPGGLGLQDDAAVFDSRVGESLVLSKDMLAEGVHFRPDDPPRLLGCKALAVNLSDLAAKGAQPHGYLLGLGLPASVDDHWVAAFAAGLGEMQALSGIALLGGDSITSLGGILISVSVIGQMESGAQIIRRSTARAGDDIWVSGTLGDAALGLKMLDGEVAVVDACVARYQSPDPRLELGRRLVGLASASADISDGLYADIGAIAKASGLSAVISTSLLPLRPEVASMLDEQPSLRPLLWGGGDDYELVFTVDPSLRAAVRDAAAAANTDVSRVGVMAASENGGPVRLLDDAGAPVNPVLTGFSHFE